MAWTHKVVKMARNGEWFDFPTAGTFDSEAAAVAYAKEFAAEQRAAGVTTVRIVVRARKGNATVYSENVNRRDVVAHLANAVWIGT